MENNYKKVKRLTVTLPEEYVIGLEDVAEDMNACSSQRGMFL